MEESPARSAWWAIRDLVVSREGDQVRDDGRVQLLSSYDGEAVEDRGASELVAVRREAWRDLEQADAFALLEVGGVGAADGVQQRQLDPVGHHGGRLEDGARAGAEPGRPAEDGVAHRVRHARRPPTRGPR